MNYQHLRYFWTVARCGSVTAASRELHLSQSAISSQIKTLERSLGVSIFQRVGRGLLLTAQGRKVFDFAERIFTAGDELVSEVTVGRASGERSSPCRLGVSRGFPPLLAHRLVSAAVRRATPVPLDWQTSSSEELLIALEAGRLDLVMTDQPPSVRGPLLPAHCLGSSTVSVYGAASLAVRFESRFPENLESAPFLLPAESTALRESVTRWLARRRIQPRVLGTFQGLSMLRLFARSGLGLFVAGDLLDEELRHDFGVERVGRLEGVTEEYFAIVAGTRFQNPLVEAILESGCSDGGECPYLAGTAGDRSGEKECSVAARDGSPEPARRENGES